MHTDARTEERYLCACTPGCTHAHLCTCTLVHTRAPTHAYTPTHPHAHTSTNAQSHIHMCILMQITPTNSHAVMHTYVHTPTLTHTLTCAHTGACSPTCIHVLMHSTVVYTHAHMCTQSPHACTYTQSTRNTPRVDICPWLLPSPGHPRHTSPRCPVLGSHFLALRARRAGTQAASLICTRERQMASPRPTHAPSHRAHFEVLGGPQGQGFLTTDPLVLRLFFPKVLCRGGRLGGEGGIALRFRAIDHHPPWAPSPGSLTEGLCQAPARPLLL